MLKSSPPGLQDATVFRYRVFKEVSENEVIRVDPKPIGQVSLYEEEIRSQTHTEDTGRRQRSAHQKERPRKRPACPCLDLGHAASRDRRKKMSVV